MRANSITRWIYVVPLLSAATGCASLGSMMSPYSERFSCKNSDHGQCIHPEKAYADAVSGKASKSEPDVTNDKVLLKDQKRPPVKAGARALDAYSGYKASVYQELQGLIEAPVTPMLRPSRAVRTLILPYADRARPDRLYMPRFIYSLVERPQWVIGDYLVDPVSPTAKAAVLEQRKEKQQDSESIEGERP